MYVHIYIYIHIYIKIYMYICIHDFEGTRDLLEEAKGAAEAGGARLAVRCRAPPQHLLPARAIHQSINFPCKYIYIHIYIYIYTYSHTHM